jgi:hypothetical protein
MNWLPHQWQIGIGNSRRPYYHMANCLSDQYLSGSLAISNADLQGTNKAAMIPCRLIYVWLNI